MKQRYLRAPVAMLMGGLFAFGVNQLLLKPTYYKDLKEFGLEQYFELDLDADMMRADLKELGIDVKTNYFDKKLEVSL